MAHTRIRAVGNSNISLKRLLILCLFIGLSACGGGGNKTVEFPPSNPAQVVQDTDNDGGAIEGHSPETFFEVRIQSKLEYCRTCHLAGGVADTSEGDDFLLTTAPAADYDRLYSAWQQLGEGIADNPLLLETSSSEEPHSGGKPWMVGSASYRDVSLLLSCWDSPEECPLTADDEDPTKVVADPLDDFPLLGSSHGDHVWNQFCSEQPDAARLPVDPRTLIRPGVNEGKAVYYNAYYEDCHVNLPEQEQAPKTCGEYKARVARGDWFSNERAAMVDISFPSSWINGLWRRWGLTERPDNFDQLLTERYGLNPAPYSNPYPLPGEDPQTTDGGSGQLPMGLIQVKTEEDVYTGRVAINCYICHGGQIGSAEDGPGLGSIPGLGNTNTDIMILFRDMTAGLAGILPVSLGSVRGTSNAVGAFDMLTMIWDVDTLNLAPNPFKLPWTHPYHGNQDMPTWWNSSHRPRKFFDGGVSIDSTRIDMAAADQLNLLSEKGATRREATETFDQDLQAYVDSRVAPVYPGEIDEGLAKQGAVLFHSKNLWAEQGNAHRNQPTGNGSCASCHGAYSPRFVNDPNFLETPELEGVAGHIMPLDQIGTDPARALSVPQIVRETFGSTWWGYPDGQPGYVDPKDKSFLEDYRDDMNDTDINPEQRPWDGACGWESNVIGYVAPPLYGVWATAPYFHNGSVPNVRQVLRSYERPAVWSRLSTPEDLPVRGFDMSLRAYDLETSLGWLYEEYCSDDGDGSQPENCTSENTVNIPFVMKWLDNLKSKVWLFGFVSRPYFTEEQIEERKIMNTHEFGNSNKGHEFTDVLTEQEVAAIIEYLKTL